jgi:transposase
VDEYDGRQYVGVDLHRRRSVIVRMTSDGRRLGTVRINNDPFELARQVASWGEHPEVVLEATYGWYWAADVLATEGVTVHLAHPLGVKGFAYRRVKNDERDAADLADLLRMRRLPEAWIAPPEVRSLREAVRHRCKLVALRCGLKAQVHAVLAKQGVRVPMSDLFGAGGQALLDQLRLEAAYAARVASLRRLIDAFTFEIDMVAKRVAGDLAAHPGFRAIQAIHGVGPGPRVDLRCRDRRHQPVHPPTAAVQLGRADPTTSRVRHHRAPRPDHQAGQHPAAVGRSGGGTAALRRPDRRHPGPAV